MRAAIKLVDFDSNANDFTVIAKAGSEKFAIEFACAEGDDWNRHRITIAGGAALDLPHYTQAKIVLEASLMLDAQFNDAEPYSEKEFDA